jgi:hypothetical protein
MKNSIDRAELEVHAANARKFYENSIEYPDTLYGSRYKGGPGSHAAIFG